jgi:hypothetical protein
MYDIRHPLPDMPYGITCYVGLEGYGKTLSLAEKLFQLKKKYPLAKIYTNFYWNLEDGHIEHYQQLLDLDDREHGIIFGLDEVSSIWDRFTSRAEMDLRVLEMFRMNRKFSKQLICTAQSFADIVIDIKRRCREIIECRTVSGRWVFQRAFYPTDYAEKDGTWQARKRLWRYSFIATNKIYDSYDTRLVIDNIRVGKDKEYTPSRRVAVRGV